MSKLSEAYERVNSAWPAEVPALTDWEAVRAASRLYRWARSESCPLEIRATSGNRRTWARGGVLHVNPDQGWKRFIHDLSHYLDLERKPHSLHHARLELRMIGEVIARGWLDGKLRVEEKPEPAVDARLVKLQRIEARIVKWEAKQRRAANALKKLAKQRRYYESRAS